MPEDIVANFGNISGEFQVCKALFLSLNSADIKAYDIVSLVADYLWDGFEIDKVLVQIVPYIIVTHFINNYCSI